MAFLTLFSVYYRSCYRINAFFFNECYSILIDIIQIDVPGCDRLDVSPNLHMVRGIGDLSIFFKKADMVNTFISGDVIEDCLNIFCVAQTHGIHQAIINDIDG